MKTIPLTKEKFAIVDDIDYDYLSQWKWFYIGGYAARHKRNSGKQITILMHRAILKTPSEMEVDHINHDGLDNRRNNIRNCTNSQNLANSTIHSNNTSGYKGVTWDKSRNKWMALIRYNKKRIYLGRFDDIEKATKAYTNAAKTYYGEFAYKESL